MTSFLFMNLGCAQTPPRRFYFGCYRINRTRYKRKETMSIRWPVEWKYEVVPPRLETHQCFHTSTSTSKLQSTIMFSLKLCSGACCFDRGDKFVVVVIVVDSARTGTLTPVKQFGSILVKGKHLVIRAMQEKNWTRITSQCGLYLRK
jgi:hypothetical protein